MPNEPPKQRCMKVENQCKICLQHVSTKTGVQCQGACMSWVHYECLNYTPGKIKDIQDGHIVLACPCPDCKTSVPKEFRKEEPFTCNNVTCPANNPPACEDYDCQANEMSRTMPARCPPPGTLRTCGERTCRDYAGPRLFKSEKDDSCMEGFTLNTNCGDQDKGGGPGGMAGGMPGPMPGGLPLSQDALQEMFNTVGNLTQQLNNMMENLSRLAGGGGGGNGNLPGAPGMRPCGTSGSCGGKAGCKKCGTGGDESSGGGTISRKQCSGTCGQPGQSTCSQPCHCPGNPVQRR